MLIIYNVLQLVLLLLLWPIIFLVVLFKEKYRKRILYRFGLGLPRRESWANPSQKTIWIHALSLGEVTSAIPLLLGIRSKFENVNIVFSSTTLTGSRIAAKNLPEHVDLIIPFPLDIYPVVSFFIKRLKPDLFILIETDFWPNLQGLLNSKEIASLLVNGRISQKSMESYQKYSFFFEPLFSSFTHLSMQTKSDREKLIRLGVQEKKTHTLGNLKFDTALPDLQDTPNLDIALPEDSIIIVAGSTHEGEEELLFDTFQSLLKEHQIFLVIAPRNIQRVPSINRLAASHGFVCGRRSQKISYLQNILLLDSIGELFVFYRNADIAFVGGSLVPKGGHNPIEPSILGVPVVFGPHMEDFSEISQGLIEAGGGHRVDSTESLYLTFEKLIVDENFRRHSGSVGFQYVKDQQGVINRHLDLISQLL